MIRHVEFMLPMPDDSTVEVWCQMDRLVVSLETPNDRTALVQLSDSLRRMVVDIDEQVRAIGGDEQQG